MQALSGEEISIYGHGTQARLSCYIDDLVVGLIRLKDSPDDFTGPVSLGNPNEFTIKELAGHILTLTGSCGKLNDLLLLVDGPQ